jgi:hypothetical protein
MRDTVVSLTRILKSHCAIRTRHIIIIILILIIYHEIIIIIIQK